MKQANKNVVDTQVQPNSSQDVVGFTAVNNAASIVQNKSAHDENNGCGNSQ